MSGGANTYHLPVMRYRDVAQRALVRRAVLVPAILLLLAMVATHAGALYYPLVPGSPTFVRFLVTLFVRITTVFVLTIAILRYAVGSARPAWLPDGGFSLHVLLVSFASALPALLQMQLGNFGSMLTSLLANLLSILLLAFLSPWTVAVAVEWPLAWRPTAWLHDFGRWLPQRIGWGLALLIPLGALQSLLAGLRLSETIWFWPAAVVGGLLGFLMLMIRLALDVAAYRRVAQG